jgi:hypothetical protein
MTDIQAGIDAAPDADLRRVIKAACKKSKIVECILAEHLLFRESAFGNDSTSNSKGSNAKKRKAKTQSGLEGRAARGGAKISPVDNKYVKLRFAQCSQCKGSLMFLRMMTWHVAGIRVSGRCFQSNKQSGVN